VPKNWQSATSDRRCTGIWALCEAHLQQQSDAAHTALDLKSELDIIEL